MVGSDTINTSSSSSSPSPTPTPSQPCAACKILRRRCAEKCVLAPYFPPNDPIKFTTAHRVFGASNIIKLLQEVPEAQREDAVSSMVYEANARVRDPMYGCAGAICQLQKHITQLQEQLAKAEAEIVSMQCHHSSNLMAFLCSSMSMDDESPPSYSDSDYFFFSCSPPPPPHTHSNSSSSSDNTTFGLQLDDPLLSLPLDVNTTLPNSLCLFYQQ